MTIGLTFLLTKVKITLEVLTTSPRGVSTPGGGRSTIFRWVDTVSLYTNSHLTMLDPLMFTAESTVFALCLPLELFGPQTVTISVPLQNLADYKLSILWPARVVHW